MRVGPRRGAAVVVALVALVTLAGCRGTPSPSGPSGQEGAAAETSRVDVATPQLRALKRQAAVEDCTPGRGSSQLPDVTLPCLGGGRDVTLSSLRGPLVINLFAQWCGPCRSEMPYYQQLHEKGHGTVRVVGVDYLDTRPDLALALVKQTGVTYPLLADPAGRLRADFGIRGLPGLVTVDRAGKVHVEFRVVRSYAELRDLVQQRLGVRLPA